MQAQIGIVPTPRIDTLQWRITTRVYVSPTGSDSAEGTRQRPLRTFDAALRAIPFPETGDVYAEIVMMEGTYRQRCVQTVDQFTNGRARKNISVRGLGTVILDGKGLLFSGTDGIVTLRGSHIAVRNIQTMRGPCAGITVIGPATDVLIDSSSIDTCVSHGLYFYKVDRGMMSHSWAREAAGSDIGKPGRAFGSAIKLLYCSNIIVRGCRSEHNWGEGICVNRVERCIVEDCLVTDNFGIGVYLDMASVTVIRNNRIYYDPTNRSHWAADAPAPGVGVSNELHCAFNTACDAFNTGVQDCRYLCQGLGCDFKVRMTDSCFVYNNVIVHSGAGLDVFELFNIDCYRTVEFTHNTVIGGGGVQRSALLWINVAMLIRDVSMLVANNLFLQDDGSAAAGASMCRFGDNDLTPVLPRIELANNAWNRTPDCPLGGPSPRVINVPVPVFDTSMVDMLDPQRGTFDYGTGAPVSYVTTDIYGRPRGARPTIGAMEGGTAAGVRAVASETVRLRPQPAGDHVDVVIDSPSDVVIVNTQGVVVGSYRADMPFRIDCTLYPPGIYLVHVVSGPYHSTECLCIIR